MFEVRISKSTLKNLVRMPEKIQKRMGHLVDDLHEKGPVRTEWPNYSKLEKNKYHCHLDRKWVACWHCERQTTIIEVYYAGSRENAPY
jgi:hypothetical protein